MTCLFHIYCLDASGKLRGFLSVLSIILHCSMAIRAVAIGFAIERVGHNVRAIIFVAGASLSLWSLMRVLRPCPSLNKARLCYSGVLWELIRLRNVVGFTSMCYLLFTTKYI